MEADISRGTAGVDIIGSNREVKRDVREVKRDVREVRSLTRSSKKREGEQQRNEWLVER